MIKICQIRIYAKYNQIIINKNIFKKIYTAFFDREKKTLHIAVFIVGI